MSNIQRQQNKYGQKIWVDIDTHIGQAIVKKGIYDEKAVYYIDAILKTLKDPVCLDIGSHIGNHALVMSRYSQMVYCFEPQPDYIELLVKNIQENKLENIKIFPHGLSDKNETLTFYKEGSTFVSHLQAQNSSVDTLVVKIGDEVLLENHIKKIHFIKIDIEGFEARALLGLKNSIRDSQPIVIMEWNNNITREQFKEYDLFNTVFANYKVLAISHNHHKTYWGNKWYSQILRFFYRKVVGKRQAILTFNPALDYTNVILIPVSASKDIQW